MRFFEAVEVNETTPVQYAAVYVMKWQAEWGTPDLLFKELETDPTEQACMVERQRAIAIIEEEMDRMRPTAPCREPLHWVMTRILSGSQPKNTVHKID